MFGIIPCVIAINIITNRAMLYPMADGKGNCAAAIFPICRAWICPHSAIRFLYSMEWYPDTKITMFSKISEPMDLLLMALYVMHELHN